MSDYPSLPFKPNIAAAPLYVGGQSIETIQQAYGLESVTKLASNENPFPPSSAVVAAIQQAATTLNRYPPMDDGTLREALAAALGRGLTANHFVTGNGGCDILSRIAFSFLTPEDECIICRPTFPVYENTARRMGAKIVYADLDSTHFTYNIEAILAAITDRTRIIYICSPNNPTGTIITRPQMEQLLEHVPDHTLVVMDEVYHHFVTQTEQHTDSLSYIQQDNKPIIILHSFSKVFGLAGLRLGYGITAPEIAGYLTRAREPFHLSKLVIEGGLAALQDEDYVSRMVDLVVFGRHWLREKLSEMKIKNWSSQANFILFQPPFPADLVSERLLQRGFIVRPMAQFYLPTHLRVTVGRTEENESFITALQATLEELDREDIPSAISEETKGEFKF